MADSIIKPVLGTRLDSRHPLSQGLVGCWLFNEGAGTSVADLSGNNKYGTLIGTAGWRPTEKGMALDWILFLRAKKTVI